MQRLPVATNCADAGAASAASPAACARAMLDGLPQVMWFIRRQMRSHRTQGLSVPQFRTLVLLDHSPTASLSLVAEHLGAAPPTASRIVAGLVAKGYVTRKSCPGDRRQLALLLTSRGRSTLGRARAETQARLADEVAHLPLQQRQTLVEAAELLKELFAPPAATSPCAGPARAPRRRAATKH